jgi:DnaJ-class molecular chaperone
MDYYSILGIHRNASDKDIRKAYKQKSMQHHPDRGGNEEEFKKVNEAYQTLKDPQKRAAYDNPQPRFDTSSMRGGAGFEDIFSQMFGQGMYRDIHRRPKNADVKIKVSIAIEEIFTGKQILASYRLRNGKEETVDLNIPIGAGQGDTIKFAGLGDNSIPGPRGDLYVIIDIMPHRMYNISNNDVHTTAKVNCLEIITGTKTQIRTPEGKDIELRIPPGTKNNTVFSMPGYGLPNARTNSRGSFYIKIEAEIPKLNEQEINKIREVLDGS